MALAALQRRRVATPQALGPRRRSPEKLTVEVAPLERLSEEQRAACRALSGSVFHSEAWAGLFPVGLRRYAALDEKGRVAGAFSLYEQRRFGLRVLRNPPFTPVAGPVMDIRSQHPVAVLYDRRAVVEAMALFLIASGPPIISLALEHDVLDVLPFCWRGFKVTPRYTYRLNLRRPWEEVVKGFTQERRRNLAKAQRDGLVVAPAVEPQVIRELVIGTFRRSGGGLDLEVLDRVLSSFARTDNSYGFITWSGERPLACAWVVHDQETAYYLLGGYADEGKHHGAGAMAMVECIKHARELGLQVFDFEGSSIPPIERYFRGFGGELTHYFTVSRAWLPLEMALKLRKRSLF